MSDCTAYSPRSGTKVTKVTNNHVVVVFFVFFVIFVAEREPSDVSAASTQAQAPQTQAPQPQPRPVFRAGAHYVRVDAYPTGKDGRIVEGLTKDDFEIFEDGKPQTIENAEFVTFDTWTPDGERRDPRTQQDAYDLLADPSWRVFVIVIDRQAYGMRGQYYMRGPLHQFLERNLGPRDLFGLLTTDNKWTDLALGQKTTVADKVIDSERWLDAGDAYEDMDLVAQCNLPMARKRLDDTYSLLEGLVRLLSLIREEKKSVVFVADGLATPGIDKSSQSAGNSPIPGLPYIPGIPNNPGRPITPGPRVRPPTSGGPGSSGGSVTGGHGDRIVTPSSEVNCAAMRQRLSNIDFMERFTTLLRDARRGNVAFYPISPAGLQTVPFRDVPHPTEGALNWTAYRAMNAGLDNLRSLASETDGIAVVNTNDLSGGMRQIANDIQSYYVLGYYTTNTTWDGGVRQIKVRLKPKRITIRARRQYRAPTLGEIAALTSPSAVADPTAEERALAPLARVRPSAPFLSYAAPAGPELAIVLELPHGTGAWEAGTDITVIAETADEDVVGSTRETLKAAGHVALLHVPVDGSKPATRALVKLRTDGMIFTEKLTVPPPTMLVGDPIQYRNGAMTVLLSCARTDAVRLEWPVLATIENLQARLLDRNGRPLAVPVSLAQRERRLVGDMSLAPLAHGDYLVELVVSSGAARERKLTPIRVQ